MQPIHSVYRATAEPAPVRHPSDFPGAVPVAPEDSVAGPVSEMARLDYSHDKTTAYTEDINYTGGPDQAATRAYLEAIPADLTGMRVADVGCGEGKLPNEVLAARGPSLVVGLDLSQEFLAQAVAEKAPEAGYLRADMHRLPLASGALDLVTSRFALHYSDKLPVLFRELARSLRPGGELLFLTNATRGKNGLEVPPEVARDRWIPIRLSERVRVNNLAHSERDYLRALEGAGFELVSLERFAANHKVDPSYPHRDRVDLNAVVVRARRRPEPA